MKASTAWLIVLLVALRGYASAADSRLRVGVGFEGPISGETMFEVERMVGDELKVITVPIVPTATAVAAARRFVAGDPDDRLDGLIVFSLPPDSFKTERNLKEISFSGTYQITTLDLSTMAEDRHQFTFTDSEPVLSGVSALLAVPAQLVAERTTGKNLVSASTYQASQSVQARVEAKLVAATRLYLATSPIRSLHPLKAFETAQHLLDAGEGDAAMAVFKSLGMNSPKVTAMVNRAHEQMARSKAAALLGKALGAMAGGDRQGAVQMLAAYEKEPAADSARLAGLRRALQAQPPPADGVLERALRSDVPGLDRAAFIAMVKQLFNERAGAEPETVEAAKAELDVIDKNSPGGLKNRLDGYASALGKSVELMSLRCGCEAHAQLKAEPTGAALLKGRFAPSFHRPQVGLP